MEVSKPSESVTVKAMFENNMLREEWENHLRYTEMANLEDYLKTRFGIIIGFSKNQQLVFLKQGAKEILIADTPFGALTKVIQFQLRKMVSIRTLKSTIVTPTIRILGKYAEETYFLFADEAFVRDIHLYVDDPTFIQYMASTRVGKWEFVSTLMAEVLLGVRTPRHELQKIEIIDFGDWATNKERPFYSYVIKMNEHSIVQAVEVKSFAEKNNLRLRKFTHGGKTHFYFGEFDFISVWFACYNQIPELDFVRLEDQEDVPEPLSSILEPGSSMMEKYLWSKEKTKLLDGSGPLQKNIILYGSEEAAHWFRTCLSNRRARQMSSVLLPGMHIDEVVNSLFKWLKGCNCCISEILMEKLILSRMAAMNLSFDEKGCLTA